MKSFASTLTKTGIYFSTFIPAVSLADVQSGADAARPLNKDGSQAVPGTLFGNDGVFRTIANVLIFLVGAIAVIMLIVGGLRYVISSGDAGRVKQAKDTILYAIVGIVVAILAYAIVSFVTQNVK